MAEPVRSVGPVIVTIFAHERKHPHERPADSAANYKHLNYERSNIAAD
jgi:hypothetical protein